MKMNVTKKIKKAVAAFFAFAVITAGALDAKAVELGPGDLLFAMYGNSTQYMATLGPASPLLTPGTTTNIAIDPSVLAAVSGTNPVKWALWGFDFDQSTFEPTTLLASLTADPSGVSAAIPFGWNAAATLWGQTTGDGQPSVLIPATNANAFTSPTVFGTSGTLAGTFPVSVEGGLGSTLNIVEGNFSSTLLALVGSASLSQDGLMLTISGPTPSVVPLPASVVLFASGLIGLVGIARRKLMTA